MKIEYANINPSLLWTPEEIQTMKAWNKETESILTSLLLKSKSERERALIEQCLRRNKIINKLPNWNQVLELHLPPSINLEQSSSETTAKYKSEIIPRGETFIDLTCGMGVDSYFFSKRFKHGFLVESNLELALLTMHNMAILGSNHVQIVQDTDAAHFIQDFKTVVDLIYIDPSRRNDKGGKTILLQDYFPNVIELMPILLEKSASVMLKTSPLLDIKLAISQLKHVQEVHIISVENECKELIFILTKNCISETIIKATNLSKDNSHQTFSFLFSKEENILNSFKLPMKYIYEPNASIMKAGAFKSISQKFQVFKLNQHTHLYTSDELVENFPGRTFNLNAISKVDAKEIKKILPKGNANVTIRNFPANVQDLRKKLQLQDGGDKFVFATTLHTNEKVLLICEKLN